MVTTVISLMLVAGCSHEKSGKVQSLLASANNYENSGQYKAAIIQIRNAIQADPKDPSGHVAMARVFTKLGQPRQAIKELSQLKATTPDVVVAMSRAYIAAGKFRSAGTYLASHKVQLSDRQKDLNEMLGDIALGQGQFQVAMSHYQAAVSEDHTDVAAQLGIARVQAAQGQIAKASATLDDILKQHPDNPRALLYASVIKTKQGDLPGAEDLLTKASSASPSGDLMTPLRYAILANLRDNLTKQGKSNEALFYSRLLAEATQDSKDIEDKVHKAVDAAANSDFGKARKLLDDVQKQVPDSRQAGTMLGVIDYLQGDNKAAVKQFERFVDPEVASPRALQMFAMAELKLNHPQAIIKRLSKDIDNKKDGRVVALYGIALISAGEREKGEKYLKKAIGLNPKNARLRLPLVRLLNDAGQHQLALEQLQAAFKAQPGDPLVDAGLVQQLMAMGKKDDAMGVVSDLRKAYPDQVATQMIVASYYARIGKPQQARDILESLSNLDTSSQALTLLAKLELRTGQYHLAIKRFRQVIGLAPQDALAYEGLIVAHELLKEPDKAVAAIKSYALKGQGDVPTLVLADYFGRHGEFDKAFDTLAGVKHPDAKDAVQLKRQLTLAKAQAELKEGDYSASRQTVMSELAKSPDDPRLLTALVNIEIQAGKFDEATKVLGRLRKTAPGVPVVDTLAGDIAMKQHRPGTARKDYQKAWRMAPSDALGLKIYGALRQLPDTSDDTLSAFFDDWAKRLPESVTVQIARAGDAMASGKTEQARTEYEALLKKHPNTVVALNNLAWIYGEKQIKKALDVSKRAYHLASKSGEIADTYGWFLYKSGEADQAKAILAKAVRLAPQNKEIRRHFEEVSAAPAR